MPHTDKAFYLRTHQQEKSLLTFFFSGFKILTTLITHGGAIPIACRFASATRLWGPVFPRAPRIPGFMANWDWIRACSSAALRAFSIASFMKLAACDGGIDDPPPAAATDWPRSRETGGVSICGCGVGRGQTLEKLFDVILNQCYWY